VDKQRNRNIVVETMEKVIGEPNADKRAQMLKDAETILSISVSTFDLYTQGLVSNLSDMAASRNTGKLHSFAQAHTKQHSLHNLSLYLPPKNQTLLRSLKEYQQMQQSLAQVSTKSLKTPKNITFKDSVALPKGYDKSDWIAEHVQVFFEQVQTMYKMVNENCTPESCKEMTAGTTFTYLWADDQVKKPVSCTAKEYIKFLFDWIASLMQDTAIFPPKLSKAGAYPRKFLPTAKNIFKRMFRVYAHIYHHHFTQVSGTEQEKELFASFKWFYFFTTSFKLVESTEFAPLTEIIAKLDKE